MSSVQITVGAFIRGQVRDYLMRMEFLKNNIQWRESKGFFESTFIVRGDTDTLLSIAKVLERAYND